MQQMYYRNNSKEMERYIHQDFQPNGQLPETAIA